VATEVPGRARGTADLRRHLDPPLLRRQGRGRQLLHPPHPARPPVFPAFNGILTFIDIWTKLRQAWAARVYVDPDKAERSPPTAARTGKSHVAGPSDPEPREVEGLTLDPRAARWLLDRRGIRPETVEAFGVYTEGRDLVFPYPEGLLKRRYSIDEDNPFGLEKDGRRFVWRDLLFEGETDTMAAWQAATDTWKPRIVGLSGTDAWKDEYAEKLFGKAKRVFVVFDNDDPYENPEAFESVERGWKKIRPTSARRPGASCSRRGSTTRPSSSSSTTGPRSTSC
jgi:hypothetical protein